MQQTSDEGASSGADVRWDAIFIALDFLVRVLEALRLKGRLANQEGIPARTSSFELL